MRKVNFIMGLFLIAFLFSGCSNKKAKTIENLKAAYNGESTASTKYNAFADKALKDGEIAIAKMFLAASKAEGIHAKNHKQVLKKLGVNIDKPEIGKFEIQKLDNNLKNSIEGETYEATVMYPGFIKTALEEKSNDAKKSFTWAIDTEKKHMKYYQEALNAYKLKKSKNLETSWYVCPVCGNTFNKAVKGNCDFCNTNSQKFIQI